MGRLRNCSIYGIIISCVSLYKGVTQTKLRAEIIVVGKQKSGQSLVNERSSFLHMHALRTYFYFELILTCYVTHHVRRIT